MTPPANPEQDHQWRAEPHRVLVVDDERPARARLRRLIEQDARFTWAGEARDGVEALERIEALQPDLVLLDVQMPGCDGFEMLAALGNEPPFAIIFITAHDGHALRAFDAQAIDYLLKPYDGERFKQALDKAHRQLLGGTLLRGAISRLLGAVGARNGGDRLVVKARDGWKSLLIDSVIRLSAHGKHVEISQTDAVHLVRASLTSFDERLKEHGFVRVHRGELVRASAVVHVEALDHGDAVLTLVNGAAVNLSRTCRGEFFRHFTARSS